MAFETLTGIQAENLRAARMPLLHLIFKKKTGSVVSFCLGSRLRDEALKNLELAFPGQYCKGAAWGTLTGAGELRVAFCTENLALPACYAPEFERVLRDWLESEKYHPAFAGGDKR